MDASAALNCPYNSVMYFPQSTLICILHRRNVNSAMCYTGTLLYYVAIRGNDSTCSQRVYGHLSTHRTLRTFSVSEVKRITRRFITFVASLKIRLTKTTLQTPLVRESWLLIKRSGLYYRAQRDCYTRENRNVRKNKD